MIENYINQNLNQPRYLFHGSIKLLENIEPKESHDSNGTKHNIDTAVFLTSSFLVATAYAFKDKIKEESSSNGLKYDFSINHRATLPIMKMENVIIPNNLEGYVYIFEHKEGFINDPKGSLQYKAYKDLKPIDLVKIYYSDFNYSYEIK